MRLPQPWSTQEGGPDQDLPGLRIQERRLNPVLEEPMDI